MSNDNNHVFSPSERLMHDLSCELERRSRGGHPFSVVQIRMSNPTEKIHVLKAFRASTRIFDDIYEYQNETDLLLNLKHCDTKGAFRFIDRLKHKLNDLGFAKILFEACVVEPIPGDNLEQLLKHVDDDINKLSAIGLGEAGQYQDISPLRRYVDSLKG